MHKFCVRHLLMAAGLATGLCGGADAASGPGAGPHPVRAEELAVGQVWRYRTRPGEEASTLQINRIDTLPGAGIVFHVSLSDLHVRQPRAPGGFVTELPHLPVSLGTLQQSLVAPSPAPPRTVDFAPGHAAWQEARGGVFTLPVAEIVTVIEDIVASAPGGN